MSERQRIAAETPLRNRPERNVGMALFDPISDRLDGLISLAEASSDRTTRKELIASLILAASTDGAAIEAILRSSRQSAAEQARLDGRREDR